jgi:uncharacterized repeat protein (TIGR03843 family)
MGIDAEVSDLDREAIHEVLSRGTLDIDGRLIAASNTTLTGTVLHEGVSLRCVYKPTAGERPLWDFPGGTLGHREVATYRLAQHLPIDLVPVTVWRQEGPLGQGMCQLFIDPEDDAPEVIDVVPVGCVPAGFLPVVDAYGAHGEPVTLVHADVPALRWMALLDAVINNADRKAGHVLVDDIGRVWGIDHGVTFSKEDKLRTVLWGWAGAALTDEELSWLQSMETQEDDLGGWSELLAAHEVQATLSRIRRLRDHGCHPQPFEGWPALPWPIF